jgi:hypothetical protein
MGTTLPDGETLTRGTGHWFQSEPIAILRPDHVAGLGLSLGWNLGYLVTGRQRQRCARSLGEPPRSWLTEMVLGVALIAIMVNPTNRQTEASPKEIQSMPRTPGGCQSPG